MARFSIVLFLAEVVLAVLALIGCLSAEDEEIRALPRLVWVVIILFFPIVGAIAWFVAGRPRQAVLDDASAPAQPGPGAGFAERRQPAAPDDDPQFLQSLDDGKATRDRDRELFDQWEEDLRRREDDLRRHNEDPPTPQV
jgi:hypothetical protein